MVFKETYSSVYLKWLEHKNNLVPRKKKKKKKRNLWANVPNLFYASCYSSIMYLFGNSLFSWNWKYFAEIIVDKAKK